MDEVTSRFFEIDQSWSAAHPGAITGILVLKNIDNIPGNKEVDALTSDIERGLQEKYAGFSREDFSDIPTIAAYDRYYKKFGKSYHVKPQIESIVAGKSLPKISAVLSVMFGMEVKNMLLTAGHDLDTLTLPVKIESAKGTEEYISITGKPKKAMDRDMFMTDEEGAISSIINGPDSRTKITEDTNNVLFAIYAPDGIEKTAVLSHLEDIKRAILLFSPNATTELLNIFEAR